MDSEESSSTAAAALTAVRNPIHMQPFDYSEEASESTRTLMPTSNVMPRLVEQDPFRSCKEADTSIGESASIADPLEGLEEFFTADTTRLNLKWEQAWEGDLEEQQSVGGSNCYKCDNTTTIRSCSKVSVGAET